MTKIMIYSHTLPLYYNVKIFDLNDSDPNILPGAIRKDHLMPRGMSPNPPAFR